MRSRAAVACGRCPGCACVRGATATPRRASPTTRSAVRSGSTTLTDRAGRNQEICTLHAERLTVPRGWVLCDRRLGRATPCSSTAPVVAATTTRAGRCSAVGAGGRAPPARTHPDRAQTLELFEVAAPGARQRPRRTVPVPVEPVAGRDRGHAEPVARPDPGATRRSASPTRAARVAAGHVAAARAGVRRHRAPAVGADPAPRERPCCGRPRRAGDPRRAPTATGSPPPERAYRGGMVDFQFQEMFPQTAGDTPVPQADRRLRVARRVPGPPGARGRPGGADAADRRGGAHDLAPVPSRSPGPAGARSSTTPRRPRTTGSSPARCCRTPCVSAGMVLPSCQDTGTAIVMGKKGQQVWTHGGGRTRVRCSRRRRGGHRPGRVPHLHRDQPAVLAAGADLHVRGAQHRHQPAGADRPDRGRRRRVQLPGHDQGRAAAPTRPSCTRRPRRC